VTQTIRKRTMRESLHLLAPAASVRLIGFVAAATLVAFPLAVRAAPYTNGDVFASLPMNSYSTCPSGHGSIAEFTPAGTPVQSRPTSGSCPTGSVFDTGGNLYVAGAANPPTGQTVVDKYDNNFTSVGVFGSGYNQNPESILWDQSGHAYVGQADGTRRLLKFDTSGAALASYAPAVESRGTDWIELDADQCTIFYTSEGTHVKRFNVCTNTQLPDFNVVALPGAAAFEVRQRPGGDVLVADSTTVVRLNSAGTQVQSYASPSNNDHTLFALTLDPNGTSFWTADLVTGRVLEFDVATGAVQHNWTTGTQGVGGLTVRGEITVGGPPASVPDTSQVALLLGVGGFVIAGRVCLVRRRRARSRGSFQPTSLTGEA
jgi:hypothetical protein